MKTLFLIPLLLLTLNQIHKKDMEKLSQQLNGLYRTMHKWEAELTEYSTWALANDGVLDATEKAEISRLKGEIDAIKTRIEQISEKKSIVLALPMPSGAGTNAGDADLEEGNMEDVGIGEFAKVLVAWCGQLEKTLTLINDEYRHVRMTEKGKNLLRNDFTSTIPIIQELKKALDAKLPAATTVGELCELLSSELQKYNSKENAESHYKANNKAYKKDKSGVYSILPTAEQVEKTLLNAADKTAPNHPENLKAAEEVKKEEEVKKAAEQKEEEVKFDSILIKWGEDCNLFITAVDPLVREGLVSKKLLLKQANDVFGRITMNPLRIFIENEVKKRLQEDEADGLNKTKLLDLMAIIKKVTGDAIIKFNRTNDDSVFKAWQLDKINTIPNPGMLRDWAEYSVPMQQIDFAQRLKNWVTSVGEAVSSIYKEKTWVKFYKKLLIRELPPIFQYTSELPKEVFDKYMLPELMAAKNEILTVEELNQVWKKALDKLTKAAPGIYEDYLKRGISISALIQALPLSADIGIALDQSEYFVPAKIKPLVQDSLMMLELALKIVPTPAKSSLMTRIAQTIADAGSTAGVTTIEYETSKKLYESFMQTKGIITFRIPLNYEELKTETQEAKWFPIPVTGALEADYVDSTLNVTNIQLRPKSGVDISNSSFTKNYTIAMTFSLPAKAIAAATNSSLGAIYTRSAEWSSQFSLASSTTTIYIDITIECSYITEKQILSQIITGLISVREGTGFGGWFSYKPLLNNTNIKQELKPF